VTMVIKDKHFVGFLNCYIYEIEILCTKKE